MPGSRRGVCLLSHFSRVETFEAIRDAIKAGAELKGLICEKPLARNVAEADTVLRLADEIDVPAAYFENNLFMPPITGARAQLKSVEATMGPEIRRGNRYPGRRKVGPGFRFRLPEVGQGAAGANGSGGRGASPAAPESPWSCFQANDT